MPPCTRSVVAALVAATTALTGATPAAAPVQAADATVARIIVAPGGNDLNSGAADRPVATLAKAQDMARALSGKTDVVVELAAGVHRLSEPLKFTSADSGRN